jgi:hypothetical protein
VLADDVALDFAGAGGDRVLAGGQPAVEPDVDVRYFFGALVDKGLRAEDFACRVRDADTKLGAEDFQDRALGARRLAAELADEVAHARVLLERTVSSAGRSVNRHSTNQWWKFHHQMATNPLALWALPVSVLPYSCS